MILCRLINSLIDMFEAVFIENINRYEIFNKPEYQGVIGQQSFLDCGDHHSQDEFPWDSVVNRVKAYCQEKHENYYGGPIEEIYHTTQKEYFDTLALALSKYDYHGATSNWNPKLTHEKTIYNWTEYCVNNKEKYEDDIQSI